MSGIIYSDNDNLSRALYKKLSKQPKIYGELSESLGVPGEFCGELYAALARRNTLLDDAQVADSFCFVGTTDGIVRMVGPTFYYDNEREKFVNVLPNHENPAYYDALWAIQQAVYAYDESVVGDGMEFKIIEDGKLSEYSAGFPFVNEDGYYIMATASDGKLASISLGERTELDKPVVRLESLLPLVGELPLDTTEIW